jgi:hypothetical protein
MLIIEDPILTVKCRTDAQKVVQKHYYFSLICVQVSF